MVEAERINNTMGKMSLYLGNHNNIMVSVSGGSDSDIMVHIIATYFREFLPKIHFVFVNTGLEYKATRDHLDYLEKRYGIAIDRIRGMSVVTAIRKYGVPVISKRHSQYIHGYINSNARSYRFYIFGAEVTGDTITARTDKTSAYTFTEKQRNLAVAAKERNMAISSRCCDKSKKEPLIKYAKEHHIDLSIVGERRAEGGSRATSHTNCFEPGNHGLYDKYMPLFFWNDDTKAYYKERESIRYSDCYEVWGMKRTGCVGCPFNSKVGLELNLIQKYEPNLYKACVKVFGDSYRLMDEFNIRKHKILEDRINQ